MDCNPWLLIVTGVFITVVVLAGVIIPQILLIAFRTNLFDTTDERKIHKGTVPRLGGIAFFPSILFSIFFALGVSTLSGFSFVEFGVMSNMLSFCFFICGSLTIFLVGMADDLIGVRYRAKFVAQAFTAGLIIAGGIILDNLHGLIGIHHLPLIPAILLTALVLIFIMNAINLIDGIDGLASGLSAIACLFYGIVCFQSQLYLFSMIAFATLGALGPFFYYNVFGNVQKHKKIFMGDTGALTIGVILGVLSIRISMLPDDALNGNSAVIGFSPLLIPCFDVIRVYLHRLKAGRNPFLPDKSHIHHKLLAIGMRQRRAMATILASSMTLILINYIVSPYLDITMLLALDIVLCIGVNMLITRAIHRRERRESITLYE